ncbi:MAG: autotransporter domain-containing protein [Hyphomicrobiales bacterium]|nr:autotransporter domain-containing protein [Hyphomicrobiales bacterium]
MQEQCLGGVLLAAPVDAGDACGIGKRQRCRPVGSFPAIARAGALPRAALLAGVSLAALGTLAPDAAHAVDATWTGGGAPVPNEWTQDNNWSSATVPDNKATFTNNAAPRSVTISNDASINTIQFTAAAPAYSFTNSANFSINGAGIVNNSAFAPSFTNTGNLSFNNASSAGNAVIINNNGGVLSFNNNSTAANAIVTTNSGGLTQFNDNSTGGNAQFIANAGGVVDFSNTAGPANDGNISAGSIAGAGNYYLGSNQLTVGGNNLSTTVSGVISDCGPTGLECSAGSSATGGGLTKVGSGTLTLAGANTYTGPTLVNGGILNVTGSLVSAVTVNAGGMLTGIGTIGGLDVGGGGIVAPGNSIGTLRVAGDVAFEQGSIYQVKANAAGQSDKIIATGMTTLGGGTVQVLAQSGTYLRQTHYTILTSSGGVTGKFAGVTSSLAFLTPVLSYDPNDVFLTLVRNDIPFASFAQTPNQRAVAAALDRSPPLSPLIQAVVNLTGAGARQAFDALSGEVHGSAQATIIDDGRYARQAILGRLRQAPYEGVASPIAALGTGGPMLAYADPAAGLFDYPEGYSPAPNDVPPRAPARPSELTFWAQGVGATGKINSDGNAADVTRTLGGAFAGFDRRFGEWRVGLAAGYSNSAARVSARSSSADIDAAYFAGYGGTSLGPWNVRSGAVFAWNTISASRSIVFPGFSEQANTRYGAAEGQAFGEVGYALSSGIVAAETFAGLAWVHLNTDNFTETGGVSALSGASNNSDVGYSTLGARWASNYPMADGTILTPRASVAWQHAFGTVTPTAALTFRNTGQAFGIWGVPIARDAALVEAGGDLQVSAQATVGIFYAGQLATNAQDHSVKGNFTWRF